MSKLFIPELGTLLTLERDWTFTLYKEARNDSLWSAFNCDDLPYVQVYETELTRRWAEFNSAVNRRSKSNLTFSDPTYQTLHQNVVLLYNSALDYQTLGISVDITIPKGTVLNVDRIFIRKNASAYSSVSFYIESSPNPDLAPSLNKKGFAKGKKRFWAKLPDVNRIEFI